MGRTRGVGVRVVLVALIAMPACTWFAPYEANDQPPGRTNNGSGDAATDGEPVIVLGTDASYVDTSTPTDAYTTDAGQTCGAIPFDDDFERLGGPVQGSWDALDAFGSDATLTIDGSAHATGLSSLRATIASDGGSSGARYLSHAFAGAGMAKPLCATVSYQIYSGGTTNYAIVEELVMSDNSRIYAVLQSSGNLTFIEEAGSDGGPSSFTLASYNITPNTWHTISMFFDERSQPPKLALTMDGNGTTHTLMIPHSGLQAFNLGDVGASPLSFTTYYLDDVHVR